MYNLVNMHYDGHIGDLRYSLENLVSHSTKDSIQEMDFQDQTIELESEIYCELYLGFTLSSRRRGPFSIRY